MNSNKKLIVFSFLILPILITAFAAPAPAPTSLLHVFPTEREKSEEAVRQAAKELADARSDILSAEKQSEIAAIRQDESQKALQLAIEGLETAKMAREVVERTHSETKKL